MRLTRTAVATNQVFPPDQLYLAGQPRISKPIDPAERVARLRIKPASRHVDVLRLYLHATLAISAGMLLSEIDQSTTNALLPTAPAYTDVPQNRLIGLRYG